MEPCKILFANSRRSQRLCDSGPRAAAESRAEPNFGYCGKDLASAEVKVQMLRWTAFPLRRSASQLGCDC